MTHINIKNFWLSLFIFHISIIIGILFFIKGHHFERDTQKIIEVVASKVNIISYEVSKILDEKDLKTLQNTLDFQSTSNKLFHSISLVKNDTIVLSSNRDYTGNNISKLQIIQYTNFKKLQDITSPMHLFLTLKTYSTDEKYFLLFQLNYEALEKFYTNSIAYSIYPILTFSTVVFLIISSIFYILFVKPIQTINFKIKRGIRKEEDFFLDELNYLESTYLSQFQKIKSLSYIDELTQIYNRKSYNKRIQESISLYNRYNTPFSIIMYDIDNFKKINDTYGHNTGDKVLMEMSAFVKTLIRKNDYLFRIGGEEFVIILSETILEEAKSVSTKICEEVSQLQMIAGESVTISIGVTEVKKSDTSDSIFRRVDSLLYYSKINGKNRVSTKIIADITYSYYFDEDRKLLYEKISGNFMSLEPFRKTLMNDEFMQKYLSCEYIITDFRGFNMNFDHFEDKVTQLFSGYKKTFADKDIKTKKVATYIYKFDNLNSVKPFRNLQQSYGIETQNFHTIDEISEFLKFDTQKYFNMSDNQLIIHK